MTVSGDSAVSCAALIAAVLLLTGRSIAQYVMPEFASQPEPLTYVRPNSTVRLGCIVRSSATAVQCGYRQRPTEQIRFVPVNSVIGPGVRCLSNAIEIKASQVASPTDLANYQFFCKAVTNSNFALISSPFRVKIVEIRPFAGEARRVQKDCLKGNKVQIECQPPYSEPPAEISFTLNGEPLSPLDRYRVVRLATGSFALIIGKVLLDDGNKLYGCQATNPISRQTVQSPVQTLLVVQQHPSIHTAAE